MAACCYFGIDLRNWLDRNLSSSWTVGFRRSSSDLLYSSLFFRFIWTIFSNSNFLSPFYSFGQNYSRFDSSSFFSLDWTILNQNSFFFLPILEKKLSSPPTPNPQKISKKLSFFVLPANLFQSYKNILSPISFWLLEIHSFCSVISCSCHENPNSVL